MRRYLLLPSMGPDAPRQLRHNELVRSIDASWESLSRWVSGEFDGPTAREEILRRLALVAALLAEADRRARGGGEPPEIREISRGLTWLLDEDPPEGCRHCEHSDMGLHQYLVGVGQRAGPPKLCPAHAALAALGRLAPMVIGRGG